MGHWGAVEGRADCGMAAASATASASANTKGAWTEVVASLGYDASALLWCPKYIGGDSLSTCGLYDIGIGGAGAEVVLVPDLFLSTLCGITENGVISEGQTVILPVRIPRGTRVATRCQASTGSRSVGAQLGFVGSTFKSLRGLSRATAYGITAASSRGTNITVPTAPGPSAWVQLTASTTATMRAIAVAFGPVTTWSNHVSAIFEVAVGAAASEKAFWGLSFLWRPIGNHQDWSQIHGAFPCNIPAGTRLSARLSSTSGTAGDTVTAAVYGFS